MNQNMNQNTDPNINPQMPPNMHPNMPQKQEIPNATLVLILGICSIVLGCFIVGIILGIIGLVVSGKSKRIYQQNPEMYSNYGTLNAGRILSIIGLILGILTTLYVIAMFVFIGTFAIPWSELSELSELYD